MSICASGGGLPRSCRTEEGALRLAGFVWLVSCVVALMLLRLPSVPIAPLSQIPLAFCQVALGGGRVVHTRVRANLVYPPAWAKVVVTLLLQLGGGPN
jgi:hypothetical protein